MRGFEFSFLDEVDRIYPSYNDVIIDTCSRTTRLTICRDLLEVQDCAVIDLVISKMRCV